MIKNKRVLVVVPARGGSEGIKLKNLIKIKGKPLVAIAADFLKRLDFVDRAVVSTDHSEIARIAENSGLAAPFVRPKDLSGDTVGDIPVLSHALLEMEKIDKTTYDIIVMLQPTSPLRKPKHVSDTVKKLIDGKFDSVMTVSKTDSKGHPLKQLVVKDDQVKNYDEKAKNIVARQQLNTLYHRNGIAYAFTRDCVLNQKVQMGKKASALVIDESVINIDTMWDVKLANWIISESL